jgi:diguanylate cyclase (GGDEF)-like protein
VILPTRIWTAVTAAGASGAAAVALCLALAGESGVGPVVELSTFAGLITLSWLFPLFVLRREETEAFMVDEGFFVAMALLLPPIGVMAAFTFAAVASQLVRRRPLDRVVFNTGQLLASVGVGLVVTRAAGAPGGGRLLPILMVVLGAAVFHAANSAAVAGIISVAQGESFFRLWADDLGFRVLVAGAAVSLGLLGGLAGAVSSWEMLLAAVPLGVLHIVLSNSLLARRDRERLDGLLQATLAAHGSIEYEAVVESLTASARELLDCRVARIDEAPPEEGDVGAKIPGGGYPERWLVAAERRGVEPFGPNDAKLLDALVTVGSSALENAALVEQLKHEAFHDALTGLPNQLLFEETVSLALAERRQPGRKLAVFVLDVDRFKRVNDSLGHPAGNELLREVARRLTSAVRGGDTVARMSGDEFTLLVTGLRSTGEAALVAEKVMAVFQAPFMAAGQELYVTASLGVAVSPDDGARASMLLKNADTAMYRAKERGRNCYETYSVDMNVAAEARLALEGDLHQALDNGQLRVAYQPQIDLVTGRLTGVEALARWDHPTLGPIAPDTFIPLAEESGLIVALDDWVMRTACAQVRAWRDSGLPAVRMAVNLSGRAFWRSRIVERVTEALALTGVSPEQLELEVTESLAVDAVTDTRPLFRELEALGVRLAIDDFGTGYSALGRLQGLPFHTLKIDRSFVVGVKNSHDEAPIVAAMIAMAHALKLEVVAEGVETEAQHSFLARNGCDIAQGFLFGRPVDPAEIEAILRPQSLLVGSY